MLDVENYDDIVDEAESDAENLEPEVDDLEVEKAPEVKDETPIPEDLEGIPEDIARSVLASAGKKFDEETETEVPSKNQNEEPEVEVPENVEDLKVPYEKLREQAEKARLAEEQLAAYKERFGELNQSAPPQQPQGFQQTQPQQTQSAQSQEQMQPPMLNEEAVKRIQEAIQQGALAMSGLSQEEVDGIDYMEDDNPRRTRWFYAQKMAENAVMQHVISEQIAQQQQAKYQATLQDEAVNDWNNFVAQQKAEDKFAEVQKFATGEFFNSQSKVEKQIIYDANYRLEHKMATPQDLAIMRSYYTRARAVYEKQNQEAKEVAKPAPKPKPQFPKTNQVSGTSGSGGGYSTAELEYLMKTQQWHKIPAEYKRQILGI